jgi:hypothetical protein
MKMKMRYGDITVEGAYRASRKAGANRFYRASRNVREYRGP